MCRSDFSTGNSVENVENKSCRISDFQQFPKGFPQAAFFDGSRFSTSSSRTLDVTLALYGAASRLDWQISLSIFLMYESNF